jgi:putative flippase GtrA
MWAKEDQILYFFMVEDLLLLGKEARRVGWRAALSEVLRPDAAGSWQVIKYFMIGGLSVLVFMGSCAMFRLVALDQFGASYTEHRIFWNLLEIAFGFIPTNAFTYQTNRRWVFVAGRHHPKREFLLFTIAALLSLVIGEWCAYAVMTETKVGDLLVKMAVIAMTTLVNFSFRKLVVFAR